MSIIGNKAANEIAAELAALFPPETIGWKPQVINKEKTRALAVAYIDPRDVMRRLDAVVGINNWHDEYEVLTDGSMICKLSIRIEGEWLAKSDIGAARAGSGNGDPGDMRKTALGDALKRCAIKWGIGRYLYDLPMSWYELDEHKRFKHPGPRLPEWAIPKGSSPQKPPPAATPHTNGQAKPVTAGEFITRLNTFESKMVAHIPPLCAKGDCVSHIKAQAALDGWPEKMEEWTPLMLDLAMKEALRFQEERSKAVKTAANAANAKEGADHAADSVPADQYDTPPY